jgi:hypothetical protein
VLQHLLRDVAGYVHDGLISRSALCQVGDEGVPVIVPSPANARFGPYIIPGRLQGCDRRRRIARARFSECENKPLASLVAKLRSVESARTRTS